MELHKHFKLNPMLQYITVILFIVSTTVKAEVTAVYDKADENMRFYDVLADDTLVLECKSSGTVSWKKNNTELSAVPALKDDKNKLRYEIKGNKLIINKPKFFDEGKYTCTDPVSKQSAEINVVANVYIKKMLENMSVVEGEKLKITCMVMGADAEVEWRVAQEIRQQKLTDEKPDYMAKGYDEKWYEPVEALADDRISFNPYENVPNAMLIINATTLDDRGRYNCTARNKASMSGDARYKPAERGCYVRVKGKLAALWPFLGICAEVLILCAIILIYEKRRNKEGMDESDTDQSPEQEKLKTGK